VRRARLEPLTQTQTEVLRLIVHSPGVAPGRLAMDTGMQPSNISTTLRSLTELGLIERETDAADRRSTRILPTDKAIEGATRIEAVRTQLVLDALDAVDAADVDHLIAAIPGLRALTQALDATAG
jgi:DNA-binding MarR family transcriptional regulator